MMPNIDWTNFTPGTALLGGLLIGGAAAAMLLLHGRILGVSGIAGGLLQPHAGDTRWRLWFIAGLLAPPLLLGLSRMMEAPKFAGSLWIIALAGLIVGFGSRMGSGCTSGHGICGIARLSKRSIVATGCFMLTGFLTVYLLRHVL
jgi:uncharacterized membrane protein YedE/YeeE